MFPGGLECSIHPPVTLANKTAQGIRSFSKPNSFIFIRNRVTQLPDSHRKVSVLRQRQIIETSDPFDKLATPCSNGTGDNCHTIQQIESATIEILAGDVFERLPSSQKVDTIANLRVAGDRTDLRICKMSNELTHSVASKQSIGIKRNYYFGKCMPDAVVQRIRFAGIGFCEHPDARLTGKRVDAFLICAISRTVIDNHDFEIRGMIGRE